MNKKISVAIAAAALSVSMAVPAMAQWKQIDTNGWQWEENGVAVKDKWVSTANGQYYINLEGFCSYNWINWNGNWYFGEQGENLGNILKNTWAKVDGNTYYFFEDGRMATGTQTIGGVSYTFEANGHCTTSAPSGVSVPSYSTTGTTTTATSVSGGSSGGGSSSGGITVDKGAAEAKKEIQAAQNDIVSAMQDIPGVSNPKMSTTAVGNKVRVNASLSVEADEPAAETFAGVVSSVLENAGTTADKITEISFNNLKVSNLSELEAKAWEILGDMSAEEAAKMFAAGRSKTATAKLNDGTIVSVTVNFSIN